MTAILAIAVPDGPVLMQADQAVCAHSYCAQTYADCPDKVEIIDGIAVGACGSVLSTTAALELCRSIRLSEAHPSYLAPQIHRHTIEACEGIDDEPDYQLLMGGPYGLWVLTGRGDAVQIREGRLYAIGCGGEWAEGAAHVALEGTDDHEFALQKGIEAASFYSSACHGIAELHRVER